MTRGVITAELLKEQMDVALLTLEQSELVHGDEGKAVYANLEMVLMIVSGAAPPKSA